MNPPPLHVLHLFSNGKWTGPAELVLNLCRALREEGLSLDFACSPRTGSGFNKVQEEARKYGIEPLTFLHLPKHRHPLRNWQDIRSLRQHLQAKHYDLIHCHLDNDTLIALKATASMPHLPVIRSSYEGVGFSHTRRHKKLVLLSNAIIEASERARHADQVQFSAAPEKFYVVDSAIDLQRFNPERALPDMRAQLGLDDGAFVLGIVARIQTHRHYDDLFKAFASFVAEVPEAVLLVIGRGTKQQELAFEPVRSLGLQEHVHFSGYLNQDNYVGALKAMDVGLFLTPGTDGTCRAVREKMAMGKAMICSDRGMLPEIVADHETGLVTDGSPEALLHAMRVLYEDTARRRAYSNAASTAAKSRFSMNAYASSVISIYKEVLDRNTKTVKDR